MTRIALVTGREDAPADLARGVEGVAGSLRRLGWTVDVGPEPTPGADAALVLVAGTVGDPLEETLLSLVSAGVPVLLAGPTLDAARGADRLLDAAGVLPGRATPPHEVRVRPGRDAARTDVADRLGGAVAGELLVTDRVLLADKVADDTLVLLDADVAYTRHPVATLRGPVGTLTLGTHPAALADPAVQRLVHRMLRAALGVRDGGPVRVGLLGYGAIGHEHNLAIAAVPGLELAAVCDRDPARVTAARTLAPDATGYGDGADLLADDTVDLVVVSTPPNAHAEWTLRALEAGKHVVVEKPFCLTVAEADAQVAAAAERGRVLAVYQNRRWDADFLALRRAVEAGRIGEVFHYESFVGGYGHPCNYWHSDEAVSGGAIYDWGSHFLDWALQLFPQRIEWVSATEHKRVWHDVTNADHSRVLVRFAGGVEAEFTYSDLAAAPKPKFYVLGTQGALVGSWRHERVVGRNPVGLLEEDVLAAADSPAVLRLHDADGSVTQLTAAAPPAQPFHRELADRLLSGSPMSVTPEQARRTVAVMAAATASARDGGRQVGVEES